MTAILVGLVGVLIIIRPGTEGFDRWSLLGLASVACVVVRDLSVRPLAGPGAVDPGGAWRGGGGHADGLDRHCVAGLARPDSQLRPARVLGAGLFLIVGILDLGHGDAARRHRPGRAVPLYLAALGDRAGLVVFGDLPDGWTLFGAAIVVGAGLFTLWRERRSCGARTSVSPEGPGQLPVDTPGDSPYTPAYPKPSVTTEAAGSERLKWS